MTTVTTAGVNRPTWFDLMTSDPASARDFYAKLFNWNYQLSGPEMGHYAMCRVGERNAAGLGGIPQGAAFPPVWSVYFGVTDIEDTISRITSAGGGVVSPAMDIMDSGRLAVCTDSTGAVFGLWQPRNHIGASVTDEPGAMTWCEVNTRDSAAACAFYESVFGLEPRPMEVGGTAYSAMYQGEEPVCGVLQMTAEWGDMPPHWMPYFAVADTDGSSEIVKESGGVVHHGPFDTPFGRISVIGDPQGAIVSIIQPTY